MCYGDFSHATLRPVKLPRPSGLTLLAGLLLLLMPALAVLQYRWVGQISAAEQERMKNNLDVVARQFRRTFDFEVGQAFVALQVNPLTSRDETWHRFATLRDGWVTTASRPELVKNIYFVDEDAKGVRVRRWNNDAVTFEALEEWPAVLLPWRNDFEEELIDYRSGVPYRRAEKHFPLQESLTIYVQAPRVEPLDGSVARNQTQNFGPTRTSYVFGYTVLELNLPYIKEQLIPELAQPFIHEDDASYRVTVIEGEPRDSRASSNVIYRSGPDAPSDPAVADVVEGFFGRFAIRQNQTPRSGDQVLLSPRRGATGAQNNRRGGDEFPGRWRLLVQHQSGSLEAAVAGARRKNLGLSFGVLMLLSLSIVLLTLTSRRSQRLARQQMEFVAGVSHELRTPVAVIKSAAENLSQGVVGNADRVRRYGQVIEGEARRLGEMVERVLQYAGIESGLGYGARTALQPAEIVTTAIDTALPLLGPDTVNVHRDIPDDLPAVMGDAAALRSAVHNLVANAVKYGGSDRWVGVKVERLQEGASAQVRITVSDHGPGIPADELPHIFEPFYRGEDALSQQIHGNGLGLSLVKRIVTAHGGRVTVSTRAGGGSAFAITLPAAAPGTSPTSVPSSVRAAAHS